MNKQSSDLDLSIVIPVYNEAESVRELHKEILGVLNPLSINFEIIFIDDGSTDTTYNELGKLSPATVIRFSRNFGKSQALQAGFDEAKGKYVITMDGDLQDDPKEIPNFLTEIEKSGADLIVGWKQKRLDPSNKKIASRLANTVTRIFTGVDIHDMNCCFKIYSRDVVKSISLHGDLHRFIPALAAGMGFVIVEMPVNHRQRLYGVSKYGITRLITSLFDFFSLIFLRRFTDRPMHFFGTGGFVFGVTGFVFLAYLTFIKLVTGALIGNRPLLFLGILLVLLGVQLLSLGFIGELIIRSGPDKTRIFVVKEKISR
jgi:glycosyltransferase involved in cell wall biosynthesis